MAARIVVTWLPISTAESESVLAERTTLPRFLPLAEKYGLLPDRTTGSVAHFSVEVFTDNFLRQVRGEPMTGSFDGHANCFIESGDGKGLLIDLNYDTEALPGKYPVPRDRPIQPAERDRAQPLGQAGVPLDVLERPAPGPSHPDAGLHVHGWKAHRGVISMPVTTIAGREVQVNDEGVLTVYDEWDEDLAKNLAAQIGIDLTDAHWKAILFLREDTVRPDESGPSVVNDDGKASAGLRAVNEDPP